MISASTGESCATTADAHFRQWMRLSICLLTDLLDVVIISNMNAELMLNERHIIAENAFVELMVWQLPDPLPGSRHCFKYRLALVVNGVCVMRYDNETGKGDHKHIGEEELPYIFTTPKALLDDFWHDVDNRRI